MTPASVVVTGATGFVGRHLVRALVDDGLDVHCLLRRPAAESSEPLPEGTTAHCLSGLDGDDLIDLLRSISPGCLLHLAAAGVDPADDDPSALLSTNVGLTSDLLQAAAASGIPRVVHTGSCFEYSAAATTPLAEEAPTAPTSIYGATKAASVLCARALAHSLGLSVVVLRLFGVYGPGERPARLVPHVIGRLAADQEVPLTAGRQVRDVIYVDDAVRAFRHAAQLPAEGPFSLYNVCSGIGLSVHDIATAIADAMGRPRSLLRFGALPGRTQESSAIVGDPARFTAAGWRARIDLADGIRRTIDSMAAPVAPETQS
jgi:UDP-glucose 4-epimerase